MQDVTQSSHIDDQLYKVKLLALQSSANFSQHRNWQRQRKGRQQKIGRKVATWSLPLSIAHLRFPSRRLQQVDQQNRIIFETLCWLYFPPSFVKVAPTAYSASINSRRFHKSFSQALPSKLLTIFLNLSCRWNSFVESHPLTRRGR